MAFASERLHTRHLLDSFDSGEPGLDDWLRHAAANADRISTARSFVWADDESRVVAYLSLCPHEIRREALPSKIGRGAPNVIPAILLARLALDRRRHGDGLGAQLLIDAIGRAVDAVRAAGGRFIVVDAIHERAASFHRHHGFIAVDTNPLRLVMKASDAATALGLDWP